MANKAKAEMSKMGGEAKSTWHNMWHPTGAKSSKSWLVTLLLTIFLGDFGIHRFYTGKIWTGIIQLCLCWSFVWWIIDIVRVATGKFTDKEGKVITK